MRNKRTRNLLRLFLFLFLLVTFILLLLYYFGVFERFFPRKTPNLLLTGKDSAAAGLYPVQADPPVELDFKTKEEILELRRAKVLVHPVLAGPGYEPSREVFGAIASERPWWGLYGIYFYGPGKKSIEGPSEESRFLLNPFLLVGLAESTAFPSTVAAEPNVILYPRPLSIVFSPGLSSASVRYQLRSHFDFLKKRKYNQAERPVLSLIAYNARDFGYKYLSVSEKTSSNIVWEGTPPVRLRQYLHQGGSCEYEGGCNNMSPDQDEMKIRVLKLPARAVIHLWKVRPVDAGGPPDFTVEIEMS